MRASSNYPVSAAFAAFSVLSVLSALSTPAALSAQEIESMGVPRPKTPPRTFVEVRCDPGEQAILVMSPTMRETARRLQGIEGQLLIATEGMQQLAAVRADARGIARFPVRRPANMAMSFYGQALLTSRDGTRLSRPFALFEMDARRMAAQPKRRLNTVPRDTTDDKQPDLAPVAVRFRPRVNELMFSVWLRSPGLDPAEAATEGRRVMDGGAVTSEEMLPEISGLSILSAATSDNFPYRMNCRLRMTFPGTASTMGGSGSLIDPYHVITAGHCVYDGSLGGWANTISAIPAYDDDRSDPSPFGSANWTGGYLLWTNWTVSGNWSHDIAVIELDRPIGASTSWFGYGYSSSCSTYKSRTWYSGSYPISTLR